MAPSSTSYLQTLAQDEAFAFLTSLQKVKDHLSEELQWMNQQVQQKTMQLQGIETLLAEAEAKGLAPQTHSTSTTKSAAPALLDTVTSSQYLSNGSDNAFSLNYAIDAEEADDTEETDGEAVTSLSSASQKKQAKSAKQPGAKAKQTSKAATASKRTPSVKKPKSSGKAKAKESGTRGVELRELLQPVFRDKTFGDAVSEILEQASQPLHLDDLIDKMYNELSDEDYKRAKVSLANVLSVGSAKGRWRNVSKGMYAGSSAP